MHQFIWYFCEEELKTGDYVICYESQPFNKFFKTIKLFTVFIVFKIFVLFKQNYE